MYEYTTHEEKPLQPSNLLEQHVEQQIKNHSTSFRFPANNLELQIPGQHGSSNLIVRVGITPF